MKEPEMMTQNQFVEQLIESYGNNQNRFCFILGAGASVESGIPTGTELQMRWMNCLMGVQEDYHAPKKKPEETRALAQKMYERRELNHPFAEIEQAWEAARAANTSMPSEFYFDIYSLRFYFDHRAGYWYLEKVMEGRRPSVGYHTLALLLTKNNRHNLVITTNFDSLIEDALFLYTNKKPMVAGHESLAGYIDPNSNRPIVAKVHRSLFYEPINKSGNTLNIKWKKALKSFFASYTPVVIGYGGGDQSLMTFLKSRTTEMHHGLYWCCRNGEDPGRKVTKLVEEKGGHLVSIQGFDALMIAIGMALFKDDIIPPATSSLFDRQSSDRMREYNEQWDTWMKDNRETNAEIVGSMNEAEAAEQEKREEQNRMTAWDYYRRAYKNDVQGKHEEAIEDLTKAIELKPDFAEAFNNRGFAWKNLGQYKRAIEDYNKAIELAPDNAIAYNNCGFAWLNLGQYERAIENYNKAIELKPDSVVGYIARSTAWSRLEQYNNAIEDCNEAIELRSDCAEAYNNRGYAWNALGQYEKAIEDCNQAIELKPDYANPHRHRGNAFKALGQYNKAIEDFDKAIELKPDYAKAYTNRADAYEKLGEKELAEADRAKAAELEAKEKDEQ